MSGTYEYRDSDGDRVRFFRGMAGEAIDPYVYLEAEDSGGHESLSVRISPDDFPAFLAGIAKAMGLRAVFYAGEDEIGSPADFPERQVGNLTFRIDRTGTQVAIRRRPHGTVCGMLEGAHEAELAGAVLIAMGAVLRADLDKKIEEKVRQTQLVSDLAEVIMRGDLSHMTRNMALRAAREVLDQGWTVTPPPSNEENHA